MLNEMNVQTEQLKFRYVNTQEHYDWNDGIRAANQTVDAETGQLLWKVRVAIMDPDNEAATVAPITVGSVTRPEAEYDQEIGFGGLTVKYWSNNGRTGQTFTAKTINTNQATSSGSGRGSGAGSTPPTSKPPAQK